MATGKRALIVDDSRSARVILSRMLEQHGMTVDTAESAEQALEYLQQSRPDVIFMDHLMPGMDGFQAVQTIKADPATATIPLMMYTSQEGELYVSQARALGAVGVLPKTVRPVDVSRVLYQLHLLPDRRSQRSALFDATAAAAAAARQAGLAAALAESEPASGARAISPEPAVHEIPAAGTSAVAAPAVSPPPLALSAGAVSELQASLRQSVQQLVKDQLSEHRRFVLATFEAFARRLGNEIKEGVARIPPPPIVETMSPSRPRPQWWPVVVTALLGVIPALVLGAMYWKSLDANRQLAQDLAQVRAAAQQAATARAAAAAAPGAAVSASGAAQTDAASAQPTAVEYVPYGETPLASRRLDRLRSLVSTLQSQNFHGTIRIQVYVGDFCLSGNAGDGFSVADPDLPSQKCDLVGNPYDDTLSDAQRESIGFANFVATLGQRTGGTIRVEIVNAGRRSPLQYPEQTEKTTAGAWNTVAAQNNRVEFRILPSA